MISCKETVDYAWAGKDRQNPYHINICPQFFTLTSRGINSQASTLAHEISHFVANDLTNEAGAGLDDEIYASKFNYDLDKFAAYSTTNPSLAWHDAYTHEFFLGSDPGSL